MAIKNFLSPIKKRDFTALIEKIDDIIAITIIEGKYNHQKRVIQILEQTIKEEKVSPFWWFFTMYENDAKEFANQILKLCEE